MYLCVSEKQLLSFWCSCTFLRQLCRYSRLFQASYRCYHRFYGFRLSNFFVYSCNPRPTRGWKDCISVCATLYNRTHTQYTSLKRLILVRNQIFVHYCYNMANLHRTNQIHQKEDLFGSDNYHMNIRKGVFCFEIIASLYNLWWQLHLTKSEIHRHVHLSEEWNTGIFMMGHLV